MSKDKITDYSATAASNTDVGGINIAEGCNFGNMNNMGREIMSHLAETNAGTSPWADTMCVADPADLTKKARIDAGGITTGNTRVINMADGDVTLVAGTMVTTSGTATLTNKTIDGDENTVQDLPYSAIKSTSRTGSDAKLVTGTAGTENYTAKWNADGDLVDGYQVLDQDDMSSDSATALATQQSIKAYVDANSSSVTIGTAQATTSGSSKDFSIPAGAKGVKILFNGVSLTAAEPFLIQLGDAGGVETTGYASTTLEIAGLNGATRTTGFVAATRDDGSANYGIVELLHFGSNTWVCAHTLGDLTSVIVGGGAKTLSGELTTVRITRDGSSTFDAGSINVHVIT